MACPATRSKNASQRPGQVILDTVQKRRTSEQKQTDDARAEQVRQEQAAVREQGVKRIADIIDRNKQVEGDILTNPPRPRPRLVLKPPRVQLSELTTSEPQDPKEDMEMDEEEGGEVVDVEQGDVVEDKPEEEPEGENESDHGELTQKKRRKQTQKTVTRETVQTARGTQESDRGNSEERAEKGNPSVQAAKGPFAGITDWVDKLASSKSLHTILGSQCPTGTRYAKSTSTTGTGKKAPHVTPASTTHQHCNILLTTTYGHLWPR
ncbi:hypothetical protein V8E55_011880 [Tylopilus felleus]